MEKRYKSRDLQAAQKVTDVQENLYWPLTTALESYVKTGMLKNANISLQDITTKNEVYGEPLPLIKGKAVIKTPMSHDRDKITNKRIIAV